MHDLKDQVVLVTGGAEFVGQHLCRKLAEFGPARIVAPGITEYDLREAKAIRQMLNDHRPGVIIHLAATVGGIGANRENPGRYFYDNLVIGTYLIEEARKSGILKFVSIGTVCSYPKFKGLGYHSALGGKT